MVLAGPLSIRIGASFIMTKEELLSTGHFIDNSYLDDYIKLISGISKASYMERHHILPRAYYNLVKLEVDNSNDNLVYLSFADHCKAHWLLYYCTAGKLQYAMQTAFVMMVNGLAKYIEDYTEADFVELQEMKNQLLQDSDTFWSVYDDEYLRQNFSVLSDKEMAAKLGRTTAAVQDRRGILGLLRIKMSDFTDEEVEYIVANYSTKKLEDIATVLNRTEGSIKAKGRSLGLKKRSADRWTEEELEFLRENSSTMTTAEIAEALGRGRQGVQRQCKIHKIRCTRTNLWTEYEINYLKENYSKMTYRQLAEHLDRTPGAVHTRCQMLHLVKN